MKRILLVTNYYMNSNSANGICMELIVNRMVESNVICDVVAFGDKEAVLTINDAVTVFFVKSAFSGNNNFAAKAGRYMTNIIVSRYLSPDINIINHRRMRVRVAHLIGSHHYDAVITSSGGFAIQEIGIWIEKTYGITFIPVFFDPPVSANFMFKRERPYYARFARLQNTVLESCDIILAEENIYDSVQELHAGGRCRKIYMPFIQDHSGCMEETERSKIVYIGSLYKDIRDPRYTLTLLEAFSDYSVDFYGNTQTRDVLNEYRCGNANYKGQIPHEQVEATLRKSGYLLNIGNAVTTQIPGKLMEYISYGKPIINIVQSANDRTTAVIKKYGNGISLIEGSPDNFGKLREFLQLPYRIVPFDELRTKFSEYTPEYNASILAQAIGNVTGGQV